MVDVSKFRKRYVMGDMVEVNKIMYGVEREEFSPSLIIPEPGVIQQE